MQMQSNSRTACVRACIRRGLTFRLEASLTKLLACTIPPWAVPGQCQRISIARALTVDPEILICDEPVSALDVSVQAKILNLLEDMKARYDLSLVFISHDLSVVRNVSDRVVVMYLGKICEVGDADRLYEAPAHPYTRALLASAPEPARSVGDADAVLGDDIPSPTEPPSGCRFRTRCPSAIEKCATEEPQMQQLDGDHFVACHLPRV